MKRKLIAITMTLVTLMMLLVAPNEKVSFAATPGSITDTRLSLADQTVTEEFTGTTDADYITKYGNVLLNIKCTDFLNAGYKYGDVVNISFLDQELEVPFCNTYSDVDNGELAVLARDIDEYITVAINMGDFATSYGIAVKNVASDKSVTWSPAEGVTFPVEFKISMNTPGGYYQEYIMHKLNYTNERDDYPDLTDEQFANFRVVTTSGMGKDRLFRSASPINPRYNRNTYADAAIRDAGVTVIMNLTDDEAEPMTYEGYEESYYSKQKYIPLNMSLDFTQADFKEKLAKGLRFFINNPGVYEVHCTEGKDRAGAICAILEWLMGAGYDEVIADYMVSFYNYYGIEKGDEKYETIVNNFETNLNKILGISDLKEKDLQVVVAEYMISIGLSESEITALMTNLGADRNTLDTDYRNEWVNGQWYDKDGKAGYRPQGFWKEKAGGRWYEDSSGWYAKNRWMKIDGKKYYFKANGCMAQDEFVNGRKFNKNGLQTYAYKFHWETTKNGKQYVDSKGNVLKKQWATIDGKRYYFKANGCRAENEFINGKKFNGAGTQTYAYKFQWKTTKNGKRYVDSRGTYLKKRWATINGKRYYFKANGCMASSEWINGKWFSKNGLQTRKYKGSWKKTKKGKRYVDTSGWYAKNKTYIIDGKSYRFNKAGYCLNP